MAAQPLSVAPESPVADPRFAGPAAVAEGAGSALQTSPAGRLRLPHGTSPAPARTIQVRTPSRDTVARTSWLADQHSHVHHYRHLQAEICINLIRITRGYSLITLKNCAFAVPGATLKVNEPVPALLVCSRVHWFSVLAAFVELTRAKGWLTGPVPEIVRGLP